MESGSRGLFLPHLLVRVSMVDIRIVRMRVTPVACDDASDYVFGPIVQDPHDVHDVRRDCAGVLVPSLRESVLSVRCS